MIESVGIAGGGFGGITAAYFLQKRGVSCRIFESRNELPQEGGSITIFPNGMHILAAMRLEEEVSNAGAIIEQASFADHAGKHLVNRSMGHRDVYGVPTVTIRRKTLLELMYDRLVSEGVRIEFGKEVVSVTNSDKATIEFSDSTCLDFDLVIGADGVHSTIRNAISDTAEATFSKLVYFGGIVEAHAHEFHFDPRTQYVNVGETGFFAYSYIDAISVDPRAILWYCYFSSDTVASKEPSSINELEKRATQQFGSWCDPIPDLVRTSQSYCVANVRRLDGLENWFSGRVVLVGDSAHALSPVSGQGASFAMEDAQLLTHLLGEGGSLSSALSTYETLRKERVRDVAKRAKRSTKLMMVKLPKPLQILRNLAYSNQIRLSSEEQLNSSFSYKLESVTN